MTQGGTSEIHNIVYVVTLVIVVLLLSQRQLCYAKWLIKRKHYNSTDFSPHRVVNPIFRRRKNRQKL